MARRGGPRVGAPQRGPPHGVAISITDEAKAVGPSELIGESSFLSASTSFEVRSSSVDQTCTSCSATRRSESSASEPPALYVDARQHEAI